MRCAVLKPFMLDGKVQAAGTDVDIPDVLARDLIHRQRARLLDKEPPPAGPLSTASAAGLVKGRGKKGASNAF